MNKDYVMVNFRMLLKQFSLQLVYISDATKLEEFAEQPVNSLPSIQIYTLKILPVILLTSYFAVISMFADKQSYVNLTVSNIRNNKGQILISVFNRPEGFPSDSTLAFRTYLFEARTPSISFVIENLPPGEYAIAVVHDENGNYRLDYNLVGAPVEGYAASGANKRFSSPKFASSKFLVEKSLILDIEMNYLF